MQNFKINFGNSLKKANLIMCLAIMTACTVNSGGQDFNVDKYSSSESDMAVMGTLPPKEDNAEDKKVPEETTTIPIPEEKPKISDDEINCLDCKENGYGQGLQVDTENKPYCALDFNAKYNQYDSYAIKETDEKVIYLTFDQGYENGYTAKILDILKEKNVKATFFLTGDYVRSQPELIQRMIDEGHTLGNHGDKHKSLPTLSIEDAEKELNDCHDLVMEKFGYDMVYDRPPCGTFSEKSLAISQRLGYKSVLWSFAYKDWEVNNQPEKTAAYKRVTEAAHDGGIFLLHSVSKTNTDILSDVIDTFQKDGYKLKALDI